MFTYRQYKQRSQMILLVFNLRDNYFRQSYWAVKFVYLWLETLLVE